MKFSEMPYERPDMSALKEQFAALTERLQSAPDYAAARAAFLEEQVFPPKAISRISVPKQGCTTP